MTIKLFSNDADSYYKKGCSLNKLGRYPEALESYCKAIEYNPEYAKHYNGKGNTLYILERYQEAIKCYDEAITLEPNNPLHFCSRARVFNHLRQEEAALQDFNTAHNLKQENQVRGALTGIIIKWLLMELVLSENYSFFAFIIIGSSFLRGPLSATPIWNTA